MTRPTPTTQRPAPTSTASHRPQPPGATTTSPTPPSPPTSSSTTTTTEANGTYLTLNDPATNTILWTITDPHHGFYHQSGSPPRNRPQPEPHQPPQAAEPHPPDPIRNRRPPLAVDKAAVQVTSPATPARHASTHDWSGSAASPDRFAKAPSQSPLPTLQVCRSSHCAVVICSNAAVNFEWTSNPRLLQLFSRHRIRQSPIRIRHVRRIQLSDAGARQCQPRETAGRQPPQDARSDTRTRFRPGATCRSNSLVRVLRESPSPRAQQFASTSPPPLRLNNSSFVIEPLSSLEMNCNPFDGHPTDEMRNLTGIPQAPHFPQAVN